jgi:hypothetical protein
MKKATQKPKKAPVVKDRRQDAKYRAYQKNYNAERKKRYNADPAYREEIIQRERDRYREANPDSAPKQLGAEAGNASAYATGKKMYNVNDEIVTVATLSLSEMAEFLGTTPKILSQWIRVGKFPEPNKRSKCGKRVFTIREANLLALILKEELMERSAFRPTDTAAMERLAKAYKSLN